MNIDNIHFCLCFWNFEIHILFIFIFSDIDIHTSFISNDIYHIFSFQTRLDALNQILALLNGDTVDKTKDVTIQHVSSQTVVPFSSISLLTSVHLQFLMGTFGLGTMEPVTGETCVATQLHNYTVTSLFEFFEIWLEDNRGDVTHLHIPCTIYRHIFQNCLKMCVGWRFFVHDTVAINYRKYRKSETVHGSESILTLNSLWVTFHAQQRILTKCFTNDPAEFTPNNFY